ncbi:MAG: OB-fold domain-containing protein, partial [Patescibacteria group bacterium]
MIYALQGTIESIRDGFLVLHVGGVFYKIQAGERAIAGLQAGKETKIFCSSYIRDESVPELYGFLDEQSL